MPYLCTFAKSGESIVLEDNPNDFVVFKRITPFTTRDDAHMAMMLVRQAESAKQHEVDSVKVDVCDDLQATIHKQAEIIRNQAVKTAALELSLQGARNIIERAFNTIAQDLVVLGTHRERNAIYRIIARSLHQWLQYPHENGDMEDIPF